MGDVAREGKGGFHKGEGDRFGSCHIIIGVTESRDCEENTGHPVKRSDHTLTGRIHHFLLYFNNCSKCANYSGHNICEY